MRRVHLLIFAYIVLCLVMFILPFFSVEGYSILKNTTSELGAQSTPNAWIMNGTFVLMAVATFIAGWGHYHRFWFQRIALLIFVGALILVSQFQHAPIDRGLEFNAEDDRIHSLLATIVGISFTFLAISTGFVKHVREEKIIPIAIGIVATGLPVLMFTVPDYMGLWQRLMFLITFGWLIHEFKRDLNWR